MITSEINQILYLNRRSEKVLLKRQEIIGKMNEETYFNLIILIKNVVNHLVKQFLFYHFYFFTVIQYSYGMGLSKSTIYLAKCYLDSTIKYSSLIDQQNYQVICICCVTIAFKFNQPRQISDIYCPYIFHQNTTKRFDVDSLIEMEKKILLLLDFKLVVTTPYHYIYPFFSYFPWMSGIKKAMPMMIDLGISITELSAFSAQNLFFGCFLAICEIKQCTLTPLQNKVFIAQTDNVQEILIISKLIVAELTKNSQYQYIEEQTAEIQI